MSKKEVLSYSQREMLLPLLTMSSVNDGWHKLYRVKPSVYHALLRRGYVEPKKDIVFYKITQKGIDAVNADEKRRNG